MAEGELTYTAEHVQRLLQCSVCLDRFKQPKLLPCQHTFCLRPCLEGLVNRLTRMLRCPECRADHVVPRGSPSHFPNNLTIISFLELPALPGNRSAAAQSPRDGSQGAATTAGSQSHTAGRSQTHNRTADAANRGPEGAEGARGGGGCAACHTETRLARCSHCDQLLCEACKRAHMGMVRTDINRLVSQVRRALPQVTDQINQVGHKGAQLQDRCESLKSEISDAIDKHIRELKSRERLLRDDVDTFLVSELRGLRTHQENLEVELASMASFCDSIESALSRTRRMTDGDLVEMKRQCVENMQTLRDYEDGTVRSPVPRHIQLSAESQFLTTTISHFGDLIITSGTSTIQASDTTARPAGRLVSTAQASNASAPPEDRPGRPGRRHRLPAAPDLAPPVLTSQPSSHTPRPRVSPHRHARSAQVNFADGDLREEDPPEPTPRPRRRSRRQLSDTRVAGLMGGGEDFSISRLIRNSMRSLHRLGALPPRDETSDHTESSPERELLDRGLLARRRALRPQDTEEPETGLAPSLTFPSRHPTEPAVRFDVSLVSPEAEETSEALEASPDGVLSFLTADHSPSMYVSTPRNKYGQKGQAMVRFGERGTEQCQFTWPRGVAVSPLDDHIFVSDSSNHRVQVFDSTGVYLHTLGRYGQGEGEFDCLAGITVNGLGQVIIVDRYNHRVQIFDRHGQFQRSFGSEGSDDGELNYPWGVACDNMGFIYVCDKENHRIQVFQSNGAFVRTFGHLGRDSGQFDNPHYVAVSSDNKVYVTDSSNHRVQVFSIYGDFLFSFGVSGTLRGQMKFPRGIAIDNQGFVVLADSGNNRVQIFRADGRYFSMFGGWGSENGQFKGMEGLAILANGNIVVSDRENHRIQVF